MAEVIITLSDTPKGGVSIHTNFRPAIGAPCTNAQSAALDIISRTKREWGMDVPLLSEVDIDAVYRNRPRSHAEKIDPETIARLQDIGRGPERGR